MQSNLGKFPGEILLQIIGYFAEGIFAYASVLFLFTPLVRSNFSELLLRRDQSFVPAFIDRKNVLTPAQKGDEAPGRRSHASFLRGILYERSKRNLTENSY
jgi:hypothetical protein